MTTPTQEVANGAYHYFLPGRLDKPPRICEVYQPLVFFTDDPEPVRIDKLSGTLIRLGEVGLPIQLGKVEAKEEGE